MSRTVFIIDSLREVAGTLAGTTPFRSRYRLAALCLAGALGTLGLTTTALAQFPDRPVTMLAGYPPGGMVDIVARVLAEGMKAKFPKGLLIVTRPGAAGTVAVAEAVRSKPDGYTFVLTPNSALVIAPQLNPVAYKNPDDYEPFINLVSYYPMIVVREDARWKTIQEFVNDAKANAGKFKVGSPGEGTSSHLNLEELMVRAGMKVIHVPYQGWGQSSPALLGGHIDALVAQPGEVKPQVDGKRMRALITFQEQRHALFSDIPTAKELGWDVTNGVLFMLLAPKGVPAPVLQYLHDAARDAIKDARFIDAMATRGINVDYRSADPLRATLWREFKSNGDLLRKIGMVKP
jgi:tripartite-type tricarboxylate transporter receptor subunit TctC